MGTQDLVGRAHLLSEPPGVGRTDLGSPVALDTSDGCVNAFLNRPIEEAWPYLWIDATYLKTREDGQIMSTAAIIAVGVNSNGKREVLGVATGPSEAETFWKAFLRSLAERSGPRIKPSPFLPGLLRAWWSIPVVKSIRKGVATTRRPAQGS